jgi:hypothetical protein
MAERVDTVTDSRVFAGDNATWKFRPEAHPRRHDAQIGATVPVDARSRCSSCPVLAHSAHAPNPDPLDIVVI